MLSQIALNDLWNLGSPSIFSGSTANYYSSSFSQKQMTISPEKKEALYGIGKVIGAIIAEAILSGVLYVILALMIGISVTYLQVFGVLLLIRLLVSLAKMS